MQQHYMQGKVNNVTMDDVWNNLDVILGMFLVNSAPTLVVFDSGATHSFVTKQYAAKHHFPTVTMKHPILVCSTSGEMKATLICPKVSLNIRG